MTYYGITIGPIFDTVMLSSKPLGLWLASYMFSEFSREICYQLHQSGVSEADFFSPAYEQATTSSAIGRYHDRIIFQSRLSKSDIVEVVQVAISKLDEELQAGFSLKEYFVYHIAQLDEIGSGNPITAFSPILDSLELNQPLTAGEHVLKLRNLLGVNDAIKERPIFQNNKDSLRADVCLLNKKEKLRSIADITQGQRYYAVIQADGDGVGKLLQGLATPDIRDFSKKLLSFSKEVSDEIRSIGGSLIYAGGDDILALAPANPVGTDWLAFADKLNEKLKECLGNESVSLSMSISIFYHRYPLYEALKKAANQLFQVAKRKPVDRNAVVFHIEKNSGQIIDFIVKYDWKEGNGLYHKLLSNLPANLEGANNSIMYHFIQNAILFEKALNSSYKSEGEEKDQFGNLMTNYFKHSSQQDGLSKENIDLATAILMELKQNGGLAHLTQTGSDSHKAIDYLHQIMRYRKFILEVGGNAND